MGTVSEKLTYVTVTRGVLTHPSENFMDDGQSLVRQCLDVIQDKKNFPPRLLILMATIKFHPFDELLKGIQSELKREKLSVPLVGCSVAAVATEKEGILEHGAVLVCLSSRFLQAKVGVGRDIIDNQEQALESIREQLGWDLNTEINPYGNRLLFCFLPAYKVYGNNRRYVAYDIHAALRDTIKTQIPIIGGVAFDHYDTRETGWVFADRCIETTSAVVAQVETDLRFGMSMGHGLKGSGKFLRVSDVADNGHIIKGLDSFGGEVIKGQPAEVIKHWSMKLGAKVLLGGGASSEGHRIIFIPRANEDGLIYANIRVNPNWPVEIMKVEPTEISKTFSAVLDSAMEKGHLDPFHLAGVIAFPCAARRQDGKFIDSPRDMFVDLCKRNRSIPIMAGWTRGEIGRDLEGRSVMRNWMISGIALGDQLTIRGMHYKGQVALMRSGKNVQQAHSIHQVIAARLGALLETGFPGGMVSLLFKEHDSEAIVARQAYGRGWEEIEPPIWHKSTSKGEDVIGIVRNKYQSVYIADSRTYPHNPDFVKIPGVISQCILPLLDVEAKLVGLLQVDLGDMSGKEKLPEYIDAILQLFAMQTATAISRAMRISEISLSELFDRAVTEALTADTIVKAAQNFIDVLAADSDLLGTDMMHLRVVSPYGKYLDLIAGFGKYYKIAKRERLHIELNSADEFKESPSSRAFRIKESRWINDIKQDEESKSFFDNIDDREVSKELYKWNSYANLLIQGQNALPLGTFTLGSEQPWFFSESRVNAMSTLSTRLSVALTHAQQVEDKHKRDKELEFLRQTTPPLSAESDLKTSLRDSAEKIAKGASAEVVSFFLWDEERNCLVLRGQHGWQKEMIGLANYKVGDKMTGDLARRKKPIYIPDKKKWKDERGAVDAKAIDAKYEKEMFGRKSEKRRYEVIGIPLRYKTLLGVLVLQNAIELGSPETKFKTTDIGLLEEAAEELRKFVYASLADEGRQRRHKQAEKFRSLDEILINKSDLEISEYAKSICDQMNKLYYIEACSIHLHYKDSGNLHLAGAAGLRIPSGKEGPGGHELSIDIKDLVQVFRTGKSLCLKDAKNAQEAIVTSSISLLPSGKIQSFLALPLSDRFDNRIGVMSLWNMRNRPYEEYPWFTRRDIEELEHAATHITAAMEQARIAEERVQVASEVKQSERLMAHTGALIAGLTHDLGNVLSGLLCDIKTIVDDTKHSLAERAETTCASLAMRINEYLTAIVQGQSTTPQAIVPLNSLLLRASNRCAEEAKGREITISAAYTEKNVMVRAAEMQLEDAFFNIMSNGIEAMEKGGALTITSEIDASKQQINVKITDEGKGFREDEILKALEGFHKFDKSGHPSMGLFLAKYCIEQHGGAMDIKSKIGKGTTVAITLPYVN